MKPPMQQTSYISSTGRKVLAALAFATLTGSLTISSAFADRNDNQGGGDRHGGYSHNESRDHGEGHGHRNEHWRHDRYAHRSYERPVYVPPPVYYEPRQSSGINFFFPFYLNR